MTQQEWNDVVKAIKKIYYFPEQNNPDYTTENEHYQTDFIDAYIIKLPVYSVHAGKLVGVKWYPKENNDHGIFDVNLFIHNLDPNPVPLTLLEINYMLDIQIDNFELPEFYQPKGRNYPQYDLKYEEKDLFDKEKPTDQKIREIIAGFCSLLSTASEM